MVDLVLKVDGLVKSPTSASCCISQSFNAGQVSSLRDRRIADDYKIYDAFLSRKIYSGEFDLFTKQFPSDFLRGQQSELF